MRSSTERKIAEHEEMARKIAEQLPGMKAASAELAADLLQAGLRIAKLNQEG